jgi:hypothetical protein
VGTAAPLDMVAVSSKVANRDRNAFLPFLAMRSEFMFI